MGADTWDKVAGEHRHVEHSVRIPMRADLPDQIAQLEAAAKRAAEVDKWENRLPVALQLAERIQELEQELADSEVLFTFRALGRGEGRALVAEHPPTEEQQEQAALEGRRLAWNPDTYPPALIAASCIAPAGITLEHATEVWQEWSEGQVAQLWQACLAVNAGSVDVGPKSEIASAILTGSKPS